MITVTKYEFILSLSDRLTHLPKRDVEERIGFYVEMIEDRIEDGLAEEEAVAAVGDIDTIASQIEADISVSDASTSVKKPEKEKSTLKTVLLILGSPLWLVLVISALAVVFSLSVSLWSGVVSLWAVFGSFVGSAVASAVLAGVMLFNSTAAGFALLGAALVLAGLSVFAFVGCNALTKSTVQLTKWMTRKTNKIFFRKGECNE